MTVPLPSGDLDTPRVALAILAGGEGKRMGGPKDRLIARGKPILRYIIEHVAWPGPTVLVLGKGRELPAGHEACVKVARDEVAGQGPLRGILTAVEGSDAPATAVIPVDMPWVGREQLEFLIAELSSDALSNGVLLSRAPEGSARIEPFPCIFRARAAPIIRSHLAQDRFAIRELAADSSIAVIDAPAWPAEVWHNVNTPGDLPDWITLSL
jgi:molybdopterin-guanine dinucleotide biosynthesis protein A